MASTKRYILNYKQTHMEHEHAVGLITEANKHIKSPGYEPDEEALLKTLNHFDAPGFTAVSLTQEEAENLAQHGEIESIVEDFPVYMPELKEPETAVKKEPADQIPWNIAMVKADKAWDMGYTGKNVKIALIDSGIDSTKPELKEAVKGGISYSGTIATKDWQDKLGHGTLCAGIIAARKGPSGVVGVAPDAELYAVKITDTRNISSFEKVLNGMKWVYNQNKAGVNIQVVSMSVGFTSGQISDTPGGMDSLKCIVKSLLEQDCVIVAAVGNYLKPGIVEYPAHLASVMGTGAVGKDGKPWEESTYIKGKNLVAICAPGVEIYPGWECVKNFDHSGTSFACPHVSGAAALAIESLNQQNKPVEPDSIQTILDDGATDISVPGVDPQTGAGLLDCEKSIQVATS